MKATKKILTISACLGIIISSPLKAETISLYDGTFSVAGVPVGAAGGVLSARWGTWNPTTSTFTQEVTSTVAAGYVDLSITPAELSVTLSQVNNNIYNSSLLALAIFTDGSADSSALNFNSSFTRAILTDSSWTTPSFSNTPSFVNWSFSSNTQAVVGSFTWGGISGTDTVTLVPEPSTASLMMLGAAGLVALRRLRKV
jgi:hypothetical protein